MPQQLAARFRQIVALHLQAADLHFHTGERLGDGVVEFPGDGGALLHDDKLLLAFLMPVKGEGAGELLHQRIHQLLLIVAQMPPGGQGGQQNTVLIMGIRQPPF